MNFSSLYASSLYAATPETRSNTFTLRSDTMPRAAIGLVSGFGGMVGAAGGMGVAQLAGAVLQATGSCVLLFAMVPTAYFLALILLQLLLPRTATPGATA